MITVAGVSPSLDLIYPVDALTLGRVHRVSLVVRTAGGKALNMGRAATTMGADCTVVAILGGFTGERLAAMLAQEQMALVLVSSPAETRTCVSIASATTGDLTEIYEEAVAVSDSVWQDFQRQLTVTMASRPGWLSISGRVPSNSVDAVAELVRLGHDHRRRVAVDTHDQALPGAVAAAPEVVKINRSEAAQLLGVAEDSDLGGMATSIRSRTGGLVILTDGTAGSVAVDGDQRLEVQGPELVGAYPVGSGDSFLGGLLAVLDGGGTLVDAMRTATACGIANAMVPGQGHFDPDLVHRIIPAVRVSALSPVQ